MIVRDDLPPDGVQDEAQPVGELLQGITAPHALAEETCRAVASRMAALGLQRLPVVESEQSQKLLGVVSRSDLLKPARQLHEEESRRERFLRRRSEERRVGEEWVSKCRSGGAPYPSTKKT